MALHDTPPGVRASATLRRPWRAGRRKRSSAARSGWRARRPSARPPARRKRLQTCSAALSRASPWSPASRRGPRDRPRRQQQRRHRHSRASASHASASIKLPEQQTSDLVAAAKAAGCTLTNPPIEGAQPRGEGLQGLGLQDEPADLGQPQPRLVRGRHLQAGRHAASSACSSTRSSTAGSRSSTSPARRRTTVDQLEALLAEQSDGYHMLLFQNTTGMPSPGRRDGVGALAHLPGDERPGLRRDPDVPGALHRQGPRGRPLGRRRASISRTTSSSGQDDLAGRLGVALQSRRPAVAPFSTQRLGDGRQAGEPARPGMSS